MTSGDADFSDLGNMEIEKASDIFEGCEFIRTRASNSGLIIAQWAHDVQWALSTVPVIDPGGWHGIGADDSAKRSRRVARHAFRASEALRAAAESAAKLPPAYLKAYSDVINSRKKKPTFDPRAGL
jgi:hypothetical protein